jgi:phage shock protein PspC (stress-responsive transcriptional regulator)
MRKVVTGSLVGNAYQFEEQAYEAVNAYLAEAAAGLATNPDRAEILADLEQAIADKCDSFLGKHQNVISAEEARLIIRDMGPVQGSRSASDEPARAWRPGTGADSTEGSRGSSPDEHAMNQPEWVSRRKRLMRVPSEGMVGGVCSGIAAYFDVDVVWVRLTFVLLTFFTGIWFLVWLAMLIVMPAARTPEQIASARGDALSAREVMEMAKRKSAELGKAAAAAARDAEQNLRDTFGRRG